MKLLVPTDFSKNAQRAIDYVVKIADKAHSEIVLLHAYQIIDTESPTRKLLFEEYNYSIAGKLRDELNTQRNRIARINPSIKISADLSDNPTRKAISEASTDADYIVMGTQGASGLKRVFMGSVTASIIGSATVPVLAIPRSYKWKQPKSILLATNRFEKTNEVLDPIFKLAEIFNTTLHVVVFSDTDTAGEAEMQQHKAMLEKYRKELEKKRKGIKITSAHLAGSEFDDTLQEYIDKHKIDILAMITRKRNLLERIFNPSVTRNIAYKTRVPLLAVPVAD